jgi:1-acyl-sn-glycerol-3-phosphate acyltransferase
MIAFLLGEQLLPRSDHFAPMDASALLRYPILSKIGVFPVEMQSSRGAVQFVRTSEAVLASDGVLWITPQGRFVDARERPLQFKPGLAALAARVGHCTLIPLAIEYTFWDERLPEALLLLGDPIVLDNSVAPITAEWLEPRLIADLERTMDHLRAMALTRQPASFEQVLATGTVGVGGFYGLGQRLRALLTGKPYRPEHTRSLPVPQDISRP